MTPEERIKEFARKSGAPLVGIASVESINQYAPLGHRPEDLLIGARRVVAMAGPTTLKGAWRSPEQRVTVTNRPFPSMRGRVAMQVADFIEKELDEYAIPASLNKNGEYTPLISQKLCAEMAGLGTRSMAAGILLNRDYGLINLCVVVTTMELEADGPLTEPVCPHPTCVERAEKGKAPFCLATCPECLSGEFENGRIKWMRYNRHQCSSRAQTASRAAFQRHLLEAILEPDAEKKKTMVLGSFFGRLVSSIGYGSELSGGCGECLRECPIYVKAVTIPRRARRKVSAGA